jgi:hypothetical protein
LTFIFFTCTIYIVDNFYINRETMNNSKLLKKLAFFSAAFYFVIPARTFGMQGYAPQQGFPGDPNAMTQPQGGFPGAPQGFPPQGFPPPQGDPAAGQGGFPGSVPPQGFPGAPGDPNAMMGGGMPPPMSPQGYPPQ